MSDFYDYIIIGTGAGGGTILHVLAATGKKILVIERGDFLPKEKENWDTKAVFGQERYHTTETWYDHNDKPFRPGTGYWVGGNTKVYGAALFRLRERDFEEVIHYEGVSPEWPLKYKDFEPYYEKAEALYQVHGLKGEDPTEPFMRVNYPYKEVSHEPKIQALSEKLKSIGLKPFHIPLGVKHNTIVNEALKPCIKCNTCDGFPCLVDAKADADINCVRPTLKQSNVKLLTNAFVKKLLTYSDGKTVQYVEVEIDGKNYEYKGNTIIVACGAINSAALLLRSVSNMHPFGLGNKSGLIGRNLMKHSNAAILTISNKLNKTIFQKTLALNDFYWGNEEFQFPMGHIQMLGKANGEMLKGDAPAFTPKFILDGMADRSIDWWLTAEDLPSKENRVTLKNGMIKIVYKPNNQKALKMLKRSFRKVLKQINKGETFFDLVLDKDIPLAGVAHQCGTICFGENPETSVLDINCKLHELTNVYVVDGSFMPSSAAVNPSLTIMANAIRVGEYLIKNT